MSMVVRNNLSAINTLNMLNRNHTALAKSLQTVSSGMRINSAKDDASGYAISERMRVQIRSLNQDNNNTQNGHSMMKVAEGAVQSTVDILKTLKEKVINAANDTNTDADRQMIQKELNQSIDQINDNALVTYNEKYLLNGSKNGKSEGTFTALTNSSLYEKTTGASRLVALKDRTGQDLNIQTGDEVSVSYVQEGKTYSTSFKVTNATSLATIMSKAEAIDSSSLTFANAANASVVAVNGESDIAEQIATATTNLTTAQTALATAQGNVATAEANWAAYTGHKSTAEDKLANLTSQFGGEVDALVVAGRIGTATAADAKTQMSNWVAAYAGSSTHPAPLPDSGVVQTSNASYSDFAGLVRNAGAAYASIKSLFDQYETAYNTYKADDPTALSNACTQAQTALVTAQNNLDNAQAAYDAIAAPTILDGSKIGLDYYGNVISTPDFGSALTITANGRGLDGQIAGFTISVTDHEGNIKKSVNAVLDAWNESIRAENASNDDYALVLQTGTKANQAIKVRMTDMRARALGLLGKDGTTLNVSTQKNANAAINVLDNAIQKALDQQTTIGAIESRLEYTSTNLTTAAENVTASESTIRDADMAKAMTEYTKNNILMQASQAMLAQANQSNNQVLSLLR